MDVDEEKIHTTTPLSHHLSRSRDCIMKSPTLPVAKAESQTGGAAGAREDSNSDGTPDHPPAFKFALQLVFQMLSSVLQHLTCKPSQYARSMLNPYLTITLMFLATVLIHSPTSEILEHSIPWKGFLIMSESRFLCRTVQGQRQTAALSNVLESLYSQRMMVRKVLSRYVLYISSSVHSIHC